MDGPLHHPWQVVGPWYGWSPADDPLAGRSAPPQIQMFAADDFVNGFLKRPQHSLRFDPQVDVVNHVDVLGRSTAEELLVKAQKNKSLFGADAMQPAQASYEEVRKALGSVRLVPSTLRKLYLPIHARHYLVTCEVHCDTRGFPSVDAAQVCTAGFVIRRLSAPVPRELERELFVLSRTREQAAAQLAELTLRAPLRASLAGGRRRRLEQMERAGTLSAAITDAQRALAAAEAELATWRATFGIGLKAEIWQADATDPDLGEWISIEPEAAVAGDSREQFFPLRRVFAPPTEPQHDAASRALYFGHIPTASRQRDTAGRPRFDDRATYEIRCFVRRRRADCTQLRGYAGCKGPAAWSVATEPFRLAGAFDPVGCANRPITIRMPDLRELAAQALARPRGALSNVRVVHPQHMAPKVSGKSLNGGAVGDAAICHFSIPLITIVAMFVLNIFLPIVVFLLQLWYLLAFRFCIPPSLKAGFDFNALGKLTNALPPSGSFTGGIKVDGSFVDEAGVRTQLRSGLRAIATADNGPNALDGDASASIDALDDRALAAANRNAMDNRAFAGGTVATTPDGGVVEPPMPSPAAPAVDDFLDYPAPQLPRPRIVARSEE
jgi:hypothetical protein